MDYIYKDDLDKACFQNDMAYGKDKDLKRTQSDRVLGDKAFEIASNPEYDGYQRGLTSIVFKSFHKKSKGTVIKLSNQQLADEVNEPIIRKFKRRKVYSSFKDNIWGVDLADMQLISKYNERISFFCVCVSLIFLVNMNGLLL